MRRITCLVSLIILAIIAGLFWWRYYFPFSDDGAKDGVLTKIEHKGYLFKTWEGTLIQTGLKSISPGAMQSPTFEFSVSDEKLARRLQANTGNYFNLHYKEYLGTIPWRGHSKYIVDSIISMRETRVDIKTGF